MNFDVLAVISRLRRMPKPTRRGAPANDAVTHARVDLKAAVNAVSDVVQNRPRPLRIYDQIHMKTGDMVMQSEIVANWADAKRLIFIGDGDAISVSVAYLQILGILDFGPSQITVFDFDQRTVNAVNKFAESHNIAHLDARLYNVLDGIDDSVDYECFYTNPPWGASNNGESVNVFVQRGIEAVRYKGEGMVVIADDDELEWPKRVLASAQAFAAGLGFYVSKMQRKLHEYHLDDAPELKSCNLYLSGLPNNGSRRKSSLRIDDSERLANFYGKSKVPRVHYILEKARLDYGVAHEDEFELVMLEDGDE